MGTSLEFVDFTQMHELFRLRHPPLIVKDNNNIFFDMRSMRITALLQHLKIRLQSDFKALRN